MRAMEFGSTRNTYGFALCALASLTAACSSDSSTSPMTLQPTTSAGAAGSVLQPSAGVMAAAGTKAPVGTGAQAGTGSVQATNAGRAGTSTAGTNAAGMSATAMNAGTGLAGTSAAGTGAAGMNAAGANGGTPPPVCVSKAPMEFALNTSIGGGGSQHKDSAHFALYAATDPDTVLNFMEGAHKCFIEDWCFRTPGLSAKSDDSGPYSKTNIYSDATLNAGGLTYWDANAQLSYIHILARQIGDPKTTVHEYGHAITMSEHNWIDQKRTGYWWETVANWVAYSFLSSPYCEAARNAVSVKPLTTIIDQMHTLTTVYGMSYTVICNDQNYYQAWPFLTYLTNNPDNYPGLGKLAIQDLMRKYKLNSNETPLHTLERIAAPIKTQAILGRYWARMAYMDIGLPVGQKDFMSSRSTLNYQANWDAAGTGMYKVKANRKPQYGGANITPIKVSGDGNVSVMVMNLGNGMQESNFTATLSIYSDSGSVRYVDLPNGAGQATIASNEEASVVVVNTPDTLYQFDPQYIASPENVGLNYQVQLTGAAPTN
jgi:hypothetical protein